MNRMDFIKGLGVGMAAGAAIGAAMMPAKSRKKKTIAGRVLRTAGEIAENLTDVMGI